ncbi:MAG TPA: hypothetical protein ENH93_07040 [Pseudohongiella sp.]|nr:hypothetical protein [Pseudohongiella sp.]HEA62880.1 hypothetical protein [Pseudohongiella sp.]
MERAQEQAADRAQQQASERTQEQAIGRVQSQTVDRVQGQARAAQNQALDRVQGGQAERVQEQLLERSAQQLERTQQQLERTQQQLERSQQQMERTREQLDNAAGQATGPGRGRGNGVANGPDLPTAAQQAISQLPGQARGRIPGPSPMAQLPERLPVIGDDGDEMFVEIAIEPNIRVLEREWVMLLSEAQREQLIDEAPDLMPYLAQTRTLDALESYLLRFRVPPDLDANDQILDLVPEPLRELIDRNHVYSAQSGAALDNSGGNSGDSPEAGQGAPERNRLTVPMSAVCEDPVAVGVIDSMINTEHPAFARAAGAPPAFVSRQFLQEQVDGVSGHGTAVAGVLVGDGSAYGYDLAPLLPNATVYSASVVYSQDAYHQGATVMHLLEALSWMLEQEQLRVINMSLTGPANRLLEQAIRAVQAQGKLVVAAAGNEGPHADLLYPAAYDGVVTATAVANDHSVYRWAAQGDHVDFAALGVSVPTARGSGDFGRESGTSIAAPVVSAFLACELVSAAQTTGQAREALAARATDLGSSGHDPIYGHGLLHPL